jgi:hypothetical protein
MVVVAAAEDGAAVESRGAVADVTSSTVAVLGEAEVEASAVVVVADVGDGPATDDGAPVDAIVDRGLVLEDAEA